MLLDVLACAISGLYRTGQGARALALLKYLERVDGKKDEISRLTAMHALELRIEMDSSEARHADVIRLAMKGRRLAKPTEERYYLFAGDAARSALAAGQRQRCAIILIASIKAAAKHRPPWYVRRDLLLFALRLGAVFGAGSKALQTSLKEYARAHHRISSDRFRDIWRRGPVAAIGAIAALESKKGDNRPRPRKRVT